MNRLTKALRRSSPLSVVLMIGPSTISRGGIASVCAEYERHGVFDRLNIVYLPSFERGSAFHKAGLAWTAMRVAIGHFRRGTVGVLHVHAATNMSFWRKSVFCVIGRVFQVPYILHLHSGDMPAFLSRCGRVGRFLAYWIIRSADLVIVLSPEWEDWLRSIAPDVRVEVLPNPVRLQGSIESELRSTDPAILFLGRLEPAKGLPELLDAFAQVLRKIPRAVLYLGGEGDLDGAQVRARELSIADSIKILGWVSGREKQDLLTSCWVFALPSHHEGLPVGMLEAMAAGMPCIGTPVGAVGGLLTTSGAGFVVPVNQVADLAKALELLLQDRGLRSRMGQRAVDYVKTHFATAVVEARLKEIYDSLLPRK